MLLVLIHLHRLSTPFAPMYPPQQTEIVQICDNNLEPIIPTTKEAPFDAFLPLKDAHPYDGTVRIVTLRAIFLGSLCGALVNASNIYLGLRAGWTSSANMIGVCAVICVLRPSCH